MVEGHLRVVGVTIPVVPELATISFSLTFPVNEC